MSYPEENAHKVGIIKNRTSHIGLIILFFLSSQVISAQYHLGKYDYPVNTALYDEISPVLSYAENILFFTRVGAPDFDRTLYIEGIDMYSTSAPDVYDLLLKKVYSQISGRPVENVTASSFNQDIWVIYVDSLCRPLDLAHPGHPLNNALPNSICTRYDDHDRYILVNKFEKEGGLDTGFSISQMKKDSFTFPEPLAIENFYLTSLQVNITSSRDQKILILAMPNLNGNMDLFVSKRLFYQHYSQPELIKSGVNSDFDEMTPFLTEDGKTLFFASNRSGSLGGTDIFSVKRVDESYMIWDSFTEYRPPLNSPSDEMYPIVNKNGTKCIFSSNRDGSFDIFQTAMLRDKNVQITIEVILMNGETGKKTPAELYWENVYEEDKKISNYFRVRDGKYLIEVEDNIPIKIRAENRNFRSDQYIIDPQEIALDSAGKMMLILELWPNKKQENIKTKETSLQIPLEYVLTSDKTKHAFESTIFENLQFEKSSAQLLDHSLPTVYALAKLMIAKPDIRIEIEGHTDNVGKPGDLHQLSLERAQSIKEILVKKGVQPDRIQARGAGHEKPITDNKTEANRKINRRVEIRILESVTKTD